MRAINDTIAKRFPEHRQTVDDLFQNDAAFKALSEEHSRLIRRLDSLPADIDPSALAEAGELLSRIVDLDAAFLELVEQNARVNALS